ncbi:MAG: phospholipase, partial [Nitrospirae bacterium]
CGRHEPWVDIPSYEKGEEDIIQVIEDVKKYYRIKSDQIYLTGISMGGHGTWYIAGRHPELFAAIAPVCGYGCGEFGSPKVDVERLSSTPAYVLHGDNDNVVPVTSSRIMVKKMRHLGFEVQYKELRGVGHNCWDIVYKDPSLIDWMLNHKKH